MNMLISSSPIFISDHVVNRKLHEIHDMPHSNHNYLVHVESQFPNWTSKEVDPRTLDQLVPRNVC